MPASKTKPSRVTKKKPKLQKAQEKQAVREQAEEQELPPPLALVSPVPVLVVFQRGMDTEGNQFIVLRIENFCGSFVINLTPEQAAGFVQGLAKEVDDLVNNAGSGLVLPGKPGLIVP